MREHKITVWVVAAVVWLLTPACTKTSYKSYKCYCVLEHNGVQLDVKEYGVQATNLGEAGINCNDIERRINDYNENAGNRGFNCKIK